MGLYDFVPADDRRLAEARAFADKLVESDIEYTIMKCYPNDDDDDIDFVVTKSTFKKAADLVKSMGYRDHRKWKRGHIAHFREPLKIQFTPPPDSDLEFTIHLHQTFSWNGVEYLCPHTLHARHLSVNGLYFPTIEDAYTIIAAHSIFENNYVKSVEKDVAESLESLGTLDWARIDEMADRYNWRRALEFFKRNKAVALYRIRDIFRLCMSKLGRDIFRFRWRYLPRELISYFVIAYGWCYYLAWRRGVPTVRSLTKSMGNQ